jgi:hypothetical protein
MKSQYVGQLLDAAGGEALAHCVVAGKSVTLVSEKQSTCFAPIPALRLHASNCPGRAQCQGLTFFRVGMG